MNKPRPTPLLGVAQLAEYPLRSREAAGSRPAAQTNSYIGSRLRLAERLLRWLENWRLL